MLHHIATERANQTLLGGTNNAILGCFLNNFNHKRKIGHSDTYKEKESLLHNLDLYTEFHNPLTNFDLIFA